MATLAHKKTARIEIRLTEEEKDIIMRAAKALGQDISSFFLGQMLPKAKETIMFDEAWMKNEESVADLIRIITAEPKEVPKLRELLTKTIQDEDITHPFSTR
jgi:uncharacterized protein (DUF1778 family)